MRNPPGLCDCCGNAITPGSAFCSRCGNRITSEAPGDAAAPVLGSPRPENDLAGPGPPATGEISWEVSVPLLTNRFILYDLLKVWGISSLVLFLFLTGIAVYDWKWRAFTGMLPLVGLVSAIVLGLLILVMLGFFWNRFPMGFSLGPREARVVSLSRRGRWGNRLAVVLGALAGKPGVAGAGLLGMAQEIATVAWDDVRRVNIHASARVISLMDGWHVVMRLYCTPQNYDVVLTAVQRWAARGLKKAAQVPRTRGFSPARRLWLKSLLAAFAAFLVTALPLEVPPALIWSLLGASLGAIWLLPLARFAGIVSLLLVAAILVCFVAQGLEQRQRVEAEDFRKFAQSQGVKIDKVPDWVIGKYRRYEHLHTQEWLRTGIAGLGLAFFVWVGLGALGFGKGRRPGSGGPAGPGSAPGLALPR
jgi:hypothetical protein